MLQKSCAAMLICFAIAGCSSQDDVSRQEKKFQRVDRIAHSCSEEVKDKTIALTAKGRSTQSRWTTVNYVLPVEDGFTTPRVRSVEYRTSSVLDNGAPGRAWKACMHSKDALVPELVFFPIT